MSTRAKIGILQEDGMIRSVYHHWDGYPSWLGLILSEKYTDECSINKLIDGGDISCIDSSRDWFGNYLDTNVILYYKDRGEPFDKVAPKIEDFDQFLTCSRGEDYLYLFEKGKWNCMSGNFICPIKNKQILNRKYNS